MTDVVVKAECTACAGSGVYRGFAEPHGVGVVCLHCEGSGCREISYAPFIERRRRNDVSTVRRSRGTFLATGTGPTGNGISYADFIDGRLP